MGNTEPSRKASPAAAVDFDFLLVIVPYAIVILKVNPLGYVWCLAGDNLNPGAQLLTTGNSVQNVGLIDQAVILQARWDFPL